MARNVAPSGMPTRRSVRRSPLLGSPADPPLEMDVLSRKSCVIAMPMEAKASEVRSQARNVRSGGGLGAISQDRYILERKGGEREREAHPARDGPSPRSPCSQARPTGSSPARASTTFLCPRRRRSRGRRGCRAAAHPARHPPVLGRRGAFLARGPVVLLWLAVAACSAVLW